MNGMDAASRINIIIETKEKLDPLLANPAVSTDAADALDYALTLLSEYKRILEGELEKVQLFQGTHV